MVKRDNPRISEVLIALRMYPSKMGIHRTRSILEGKPTRLKKLVKMREQSTSESPEDKLTEVNLKEYTRSGKVFCSNRQIIPFLLEEKANNDPDKAVRCRQHRRTTILVPRGIKSLLVSGGDIFRGSQQAK